MSARWPAPPASSPSADVVNPGQFLAIGWNDGYVRLVGLENSKAAHQIQITDEDDVSISYIAWAKNRTGRSLKTKLSAASYQLLEGLKLSRDKQRPDLPREATFLDIDSALPKISPLPMDGGAGYVT